MRKRIIQLALSLVTISSLAFSQNKAKLCRTEEGIVYSRTQIDSLQKLKKTIAFIGDTIIENTTFMKVFIYESIEAFHHLTTKYQGQPLPELKFLLMNGEIVDTGDLIGKVVMINFWSTTCRPCIREMPQLNQLHQEYKDRVVFLAPLPEGRDKAERLLDTHPFSFSIVPDAQAVFNQLEIDGYPKNFFINKQGIIYRVEEGQPSRTDENGESYIAVYEVYSEILDEMLNNH